MKKITNFFILPLFSIFIPFSSPGQTTSLQDAQNLSAGLHTFNFGDGDFQAYSDGDGWVLWLQYQRAAHDSRQLRTIEVGEDLPVLDTNPLGMSSSNDDTKWGSGSYEFAQSIPDEEIWLRWEGETDQHNRKIHFESPILGRFRNDTNEVFFPRIAYAHVLRPDHTAFLPAAATSSKPNTNGNNALINDPFRSSDENWHIHSLRWNVDNKRDTAGNAIEREYSTIHRIWVKLSLIHI